MFPFFLKGIMNHKKDKNRNFSSINKVLKINKMVYFIYSKPKSLCIHTFSINTNITILLHINLCINIKGNLYIIFDSSAFKAQNVQVHLKIFWHHMQEQMSGVGAASGALCNVSRQNRRELEVDCLVTLPAPPIEK